MWSLTRAQELPPVQVYSSEVYGAENQNWSISQSLEKLIYVANNKGLLEFNGADWKLYPSPNESIIRSVKVINDLVYTGSYMEFGYWQQNDKGSLDYTSLSEKLQIKFLEDEEFWNIISLDEFILFQSLKRIYIYSKLDSSYTIVDSETIIHKMFKVKDGIYFQKDNDGIYKIENGISKLISDDAILKENVVVNMFYHKDNILIQTEDKGFYILNDDLILEWNIPASKVLSTVSVYRSIKLKDESFILGTISNGVFHLSANGEINYNIDHTQGLSNNTVHAVFEDAENNIWVGLENGISCINRYAPLSIFNDKSGEIGTLYASIVFNDYLYLGTNQGLFFKPFNSEEEFKFIENTQGAVWSLVEHDDKLFCGHNSGTFIVYGDTVEKIADVQGTWNIISINNSQDELLQGNYDGLYVLHKKNGEWSLKNKISGFDVSSRFFETVGNNEILVSHEHRGVTKIKVDDAFTEAISIIKDTIKKGLSSALIEFNNEIIYSYKEGVFKYDKLKGEFYKDTLLSNITKKEEYSSGKLVSDMKNNALWSFSKEHLNYITFGGFGKFPKIHKIPFSQSLSHGLTGYENISFLNEQKYLLGTAEGYIIIDLDKLQNQVYDITINSITKSDLSSEHTLVSNSEEGFFKNKYNNIEFTFSVPEYKKYLDTNYQYQLEGLYYQWSDWSSISKAIFKNLPYGNYKFNVRAKAGNNLTNNIATYKFEIERPWYVSYIMIFVYVLAIMLFLFFTHNIYKQFYKKQRESILMRTNKELKMKKLENKQQLMIFNNENLKQDIENKNRELGISTMNLIKKNEFLNNLKRELKNVENIQELKTVLKIIDRNLNNTDDWNLFEEAFNNADKDFLKKIKEKHPSLTSNDLRLCAYLRLNLSSKEIAPLLNISSRSVEVKRYRLRKKIGLPHESSLTDYILEI